MVKAEKDLTETRLEKHDKQPDQRVDHTNDLTGDAWLPEQDSQRYRKQGGNSLLVPTPHEPQQGKDKQYEG